MQKMYHLAVDFSFFAVLLEIGGFSLDGKVIYSERIAE
jgi:preprotein translocase subunit SecF